MTSMNFLRLGLPDGLHKAGVPREKLDAMADLAILDACHTLNPRACTREDLRRTIVGILSELDPGDPMAREYRKRLAAALY